jgi:RNA polymerase sigma-70 factor (ECF subfamily)
MNQTEQLIKDCLKNKKEAQHELYQLYASTMLGVCYRYTKSIEDAEDVLQEGFIKVFTHLHQFKQQGELGAWIRRIMVNVAITYLKKHNRYKKDLQITDVGLHPISNDNPTIALDTKDLVNLIRSLPLAYQTIFNLMAVEGYTATEVSEILNININTVRSQYSRARAMLIKAIDQNNQLTNNHHHARSI